VLRFTTHDFGKLSSRKNERGYLLGA